MRTWNNEEEDGNAAGVREEIIWGKNEEKVRVCDWWGNFAWIGDEEEVNSCREVEERGHEAYHCHPLTSARSVQSSSHPSSSTSTTPSYNFLYHHLSSLINDNILSFGASQIWLTLVFCWIIALSINQEIGCLAIKYNPSIEEHQGLPPSHHTQIDFLYFLQFFICSELWLLFLFIRYFHQLCQDIVLLVQREVIWRVYYTMSNTYDKLVHLTSSRHMQYCFLNLKFFMLLLKWTLNMLFCSLLNNLVQNKLFSIIWASHPYWHKSNHPIQL